MGDALAGRYRIVRWIAAGGMGSVWEATDTVLAQPVALKEVTFAGLPPAMAAESRQRTLREARNAARLRTEPDVIGIYDVLEVGTPDSAEPDARAAVWLVLEYLPSSSLGEVLARTGPLAPSEVARIGAGTARALAAAHRRGIVHRDVKPGNVLIAEADGRVKLTDFGISYAEGDAKVTATDQISGTPAYMAREVAAGDDATSASDVFSLASTLYRAVEGVAPFGEDDNPRRLVYRVATGMLRPPENAGPLGPLLMRMFDPDPRRRPSADAVAAELDGTPARPGPDGPMWTNPSGPPTYVPAPGPGPGPGSGPGSSWPPPPGGTPPSRTPPPVGGGRGRRRLALVGAAVVLVAALVAVAVLRPWESGGTGPSDPARVADGTGITDLTPVTELSVPADAVRPAGNGQAVCPATSIAVVGALTGSNASLGVNIANGAELAVRQHNQANPGCQVALRKGDTTGTPDAAPGVVSSVIAQPDVIGVVGPPFSGETKTTGALFQQAGLAHISPAATNAALTANGWSTFFRGLGSDAAVGTTSARLMTDLLHAQRVCVVRDDSEYGNSGADAVVRSLGSFAVPGCAQRVVTGQNDMSRVADSVLAAGADAVFFGGYYPEAAALDQQLAARGFRGRLVAGDGVQDPEFVRQAGPASANAYVLSPSAPGALVPEFAQAYGTPGTYSIEAYDAATVLLRAIDAGRRDRAGVLAAVRANDATGLTKRMAWTSTGDPDDPPMFAYRVLDGRFTFVGRV